MVAVTADLVEAFQRDGVVLIKGLWKDWVPQITAGIERNMAAPGPYGAENLKPGEAGRFFDDYCNWERIPEFRDVIYNSDVAKVASSLMQSPRRGTKTAPIILFKADRRSAFGARLTP